MSVTSLIKRSCSLLIALLLVVGLLATAPGPTQAAALQDDDVTVVSPLDPRPRAVRILTGTCDDPGDVVAELTSLRSPNGDDDGSDDVDRIEYGYTPAIPLTIEQMTVGDHLISIYADDDDSGRAIACANIGGVTDENGSLVIAIRSTDDSGVTGVAVLSPNPANPNSTQSSLFIIGSPLGDDTGTQDDDSGTDDGSGTPDDDTGTDDGSGSDDDGSAGGTVGDDDDATVDDGTGGGDDGGVDDGTGGGGGDDGDDDFDDGSTGGGDDDDDDDGDD